MIVGFVLGFWTLFIFIITLCDLNKYITNLDVILVYFLCVLFGILISFTYLFIKKYCLIINIGLSGFLTVEFLFISISLNIHSIIYLAISFLTGIFLALLKYQFKEKRYLLYIRFITGAQLSIFGLNNLYVNK